MELIDYKPDELPIEKLEELIRKFITKTANKAIPKSKHIKSRNVNYLPHIVILISERLLQYFKNYKNETNSNNLKNCEIECGCGSRVK